MGRFEKLLLKVLRGTADANMDFDDLRPLLLHLGFEERVKGSHHIFRKEGIEDRINAVPGTAGSRGDYSV